MLIIYIYGTCVTDAWVGVYVRVSGWCQVIRCSYMCHVSVCICEVMLSSCMMKLSVCCPSFQVHNFNDLWTAGTFAPEVWTRCKYLKMHPNQAIKTQSQKQEDASDGQGRRRKKNRRSRLIDLFLHFILEEIEFRKLRSGTKVVFYFKSNNK